MNRDPFIVDDDFMRPMPAPVVQLDARRSYGELEVARIRRARHRGRVPTWVFVVVLALASVVAWWAPRGRP